MASAHGGHLGPGSTGRNRAVVVGAGPNGLAGAIALARAGMEVTVLEAADQPGGGARSAELTVPGVLHDTCSAVHPFGAASPFFRELRLEDHGLRWRYPAVDVAHPLAGGRAGVLLQSIDETLRRLPNDDREPWRKLFGPLVEQYDELADEIFRPILHVPRHPVPMARFGLSALRSATSVAKRWQRPETKALFAGIAAHAIHPLEKPTTAGVGVMFVVTGHAYGFPVPEGGSQSITAALCSVLASHGGVVETGVRVRSLDELPPAEVVLLDLAPKGVLELAGDQLPSRTAKAYKRFKHGPAAYKVDLAVEGGVPWENEDCRRAGTVHVGGPIEELAAAEREVHRGNMPVNPFVLVAQQYLVDPQRSKGDVHPVWAYAHVPNGFTGNATEAVLEQIERFAPGFRDRIVATHVRTPAQIEADNPNYVGGDIATGAATPMQVVFRPKRGLNPYATGIPGVYICSAATPPGGGVHGMGGANAAASALRSRKG